MKTEEKTTRHSLGALTERDKATAGERVRAASAIHATMNRTILFLSIIALWTISHNGFNCQTTTPIHNRNHNNQHSNRINRQRGNILRNLTRTHAYDDNIVTSQLDASERVRQFYRSIRDIYNRWGWAIVIIMQMPLITLCTQLSYAHYFWGRRGLHGACVYIWRERERVRASVTSNSHLNIHIAGAMQCRCTFNECSACGSVYRTSIPNSLIVVYVYDSQYVKCDAMLSVSCLFPVLMCLCLRSV